MALAFLICVQKALLSAGYDDIILKVKQVICLESLYLKKDLVAVLPTGYGKSLVFQVLPRLLREREKTRATTSVTKSVVLVVSPLNALMYDQISKLRARGVEAAVLGVKKGIDADSPIISQWEGARESITKAGYEIVFCHPEAFLSCNNRLKVLQSSVYLSAIKAVVVDEAHCILEW
ncbi:putative ATP-dependent DNA helicase Q1 [Montipora foliosa]|uniref:putative ATP-dependent DNA helicase Q1 n=1 Tax=Montipora foliosa TaxID=591990 RepID=UPI0035F162B5